VNDCTQQHIVLVGMMGSGKSSVGRVIARRLDRTLFDSDDMIEARTGRSVREIWNTDGEPAFRSVESDVLLDALASTTPSVIAAAGGVVLSESNRDVLQDERAHVVWLMADVDLLVERVKSGMHRPLLDDDPEGTLRKMHTERAALYREVANAIVSVDHRTVNDVAGAVLRCAG
jgi:shikimate kinase